MSRDFRKRPSLGWPEELRDSPRPIRPGEDPNKTILRYLAGLGDLLGLDLSQN